MAVFVLVAVVSFAGSFVNGAPRLKIVKQPSTSIVVWFTIGQNLLFTFACILGTASAVAQDGAHDSRVHTGDELFAKIMTSFVRSEGCILLNSAILALTLVFSGDNGLMYIVCRALLVFSFAAFVF